MLVVNFGLQINVLVCVRGHIGVNKYGFDKYPSLFTLKCVNSLVGYLMTVYCSMLRLEPVRLSSLVVKLIFSNSSFSCN